MARRIPIRRKLAAALAIPIAALLVVAGLEVLQSTRDADEVKEQTDLATASVGPSGVISSLQHERNYASLWLLAQEENVEVPVESFDQAKQQTDAAIESFRADIESKGGEVVETYGPALEALDGLTELRQQVDTFDPLGLGPPSLGTHEVRLDRCQCPENDHSTGSHQLSHDLITVGLTRIEILSHQTVQPSDSR